MTSVIETETETAASRTRTCTRCGKTLPETPDYFNRQSKARGSGFQAECRICSNRRKRESEQIARDPECVPAVNRMVNQAPDRRPAVRLRKELGRRRAAGERFSKAWPDAVEIALRGLTGREREQWLVAFEWGQARWLAAYRPDLPAHQTSLFLPEPKAVAA